MYSYLNYQSPNKFERMDKALKEQLKELNLCGLPRLNNKNKYLKK
jgi:hypothetical protein